MTSFTTSSQKNRFLNRLLKKRIIIHYYYFKYNSRYLPPPPFSHKQNPHRIFNCMHKISGTQSKFKSTNLFCSCMCTNEWNTISGGFLVVFYPPHTQTHTYLSGRTPQPILCFCDFCALCDGNASSTINCFCPDKNESLEKLVAIHTIEC